jgi:hypothetical protein
MSADDLGRTYYLRTRYINESGSIGRSLYADGSPALLFAPDNGEPAWALSTNLAGHGIITPPDRVYIKGYAEHEGLCAALEMLGVVEVEAEIVFGPYDTPAYLVKVLI